jgi:hypothetical protein
MHAGGSSLRQLAFSATLHCLTGCAIGEVLGMVIGTGLGWAMHRPSPLRHVRLPVRLLSDAASRARRALTAEARIAMNQQSS